MLQRYTELLAVIIAAVIIAACGGETETPVTAGARRGAPADVSPLSDSSGDSGSGSDGVDGTQADRVLREGVVGEISAVIDGDTVHVTIDGWYHRIRVQGINAPECEMTETRSEDGDQFACYTDQEWWGLNSYQALSELALGVEVEVRCEQQEGEPCPLDDFDRYLAFLESEEGDLGELQVRGGQAFTFTRYESSRRATYCRAEAQAIEDEVGMWSLGDVDEVLGRMNDSTRGWYQDHDARCAAAIADD